MELLSKDAFKSTFTIERVESKYGHVVYMRVLSGKGRDEWMRIIADRTKNEDVVETFYCSLLVRSLCTKEGARIFQNNEEASLAEWADSKLLEELFERAYEFNRLGKDGEVDAKKASSESGSFGSASPAILG